jgi:hypothetical protein
MRQPFQDNATEGRLLSFSPKETQRKDIPILLPVKYDQEVEQLRAKIALFIMAHFEKIDGEKIINIPDDLVIEPRLKQLALPLSIILQLFPDGKTQFIKYLKSRQQEIKRVRASSYEGMVFNSVLEYVTANPTRITAASIYEKAGVKTPTALSRVLHSIGFKTELVRQDKVMRILVIPDERTWTNICQRYYYSDETKDNPPIPESLQSQHWIKPQQPQQKIFI